MKVVLWTQGMETSILLIYQPHSRTNCVWAEALDFAQTSSIERPRRSDRVCGQSGNANPRDGGKIEVRLSVCRLRLSNVRKAWLTKDWVRRMSHRPRREVALRIAHCIPLLLNRFTYTGQGLIPPGFIA